MAGKRAIKLKNVDDVTKLLARTINQMLRGEIERDVASKVGYLANILLRALETGALEARVEKLEEGMKNKDQHLRIVK